MRTRTHMRVLSLLAVAIAVVSIAGSARLHAQRWQDTFGTGLCTEFGTRGVEGVSTGGYIAAGFSGSPIPNCGGSNVYVVRTDDLGNLLWSFTYNIGGGFSAANCIRECANGDFIVTGRCQNTNACCCNKDNIFLLRLDPNGGVRWVKSYGGQGGEEAFSVIETAFGNGISTKAGDFVVCGYSFNAATTNSGYLLRASSGGNLIWDFAYSGINNQPLTYYDLDESTTGTPGAILAGGQLSNGSGALGTIIKVSGDDGTILDGPILWGNGNFTNVLSIKELQQAGFLGQIVVTGQTSTTAAGTSNAYIARFGPVFGCPVPAPPLASVVYTSTTTAPSVGQDIQEASSGNLLVTGSAVQYPGGFGTGDVMLIEVDPNTLNYAGSKFNLYGGPGRDEGRSVAEQSPTAPTPGFIIAGYESSFPGPDLDLYLIKTDLGGNSDCNSVNISDVAVAYTTGVKCYTPNVSPVNEWCTPPWTADAQTWGSQLCVANPQAHKGENPSNGTAETPGNNSVDNPVIAIANDASMASYPNPVRKGSTFKLEYNLARAGQVRIDVVDVSGKTVYSHSDDYPSGTSQIPVDTQLWPSGAYIIKLTTDGAAASQRVMVVDK